VQLLVAAIAYDAPITENEDAVCDADRAETVGDDQGGAAFDELGESLLHRRLALGVESTCRLIKNQDGRVFEEGSGDGDALTLATGKKISALADGRIVSLRHGHDEIVRKGFFRCGLDLRTGRVLFADADIFLQRP
jgi:hypothetical protein